MKLFQIKLLLAGLLMFGLISCNKSKEKKGDVDFPREESLFIGGFQWGEPNSFNPLIDWDWSAFPVRGRFNLMYEPLCAFNSLTDSMEPMLASFQGISDEAVSVIMHPSARWSDGHPLTAEDVRFTYEIGQRFKSAPTAFVWDFISKVTVDTITDTSIAGGNGKVEKVNLVINKEKRNNPLAILDILQAVRIVPKHYMDSLLESVGGDFSAFQKLKLDKNPVVSGPYNLVSYSSEKIVLKRRDDYWGNAVYFNNKTPNPKYIIHPVYKSNDHFSIALQQGNLDISQSFIPRIWIKAKDGVRTWYDEKPYFVPAAIPMFILNVTHYPLSDKNYRRAMAFAINYEDVSELGVSGYSPPLQPGLILPFGVEKKYFSEDDAKKYGKMYDPERAKKILADAGYTPVFDKDGNLEYTKNAKGEKIPTVFIKSPSGWTDWEAIVRIAVKGMRSVGIDVREGFVDASLYWQSMPVGEFDLLMYTPSTEVAPSLPWSRFNLTLSSRNWKPEGEKMTENRGRYNNPDSKAYNPAVDSLLRLIPTLKDEAEKKEAYSVLNSIFMEDQPTLPLVYRPEQFYEFSIKHWTNYPTDKNPYATPQCLCVGASTKALWEIKSVTEK